MFKRYQMYLGRIQEKEFVKETEHFLIDARGHRNAKVSNWDSWHETPKAAIAHELETQEKKREWAARSFARSLEALDKEIARLKEMLNEAA